MGADADVSHDAARIFGVIEAEDIVEVGGARRVKCSQYKSFGVYRWEQGRGHLERRTTSVEVSRRESAPSSSPQYIPNDILYRTRPTASISLTVPR